MSTQFREKSSLYAIYLVVAEFVLIALIFLMSLAAGWGGYSDSIESFLIVDEIRGSIGFVAFVILPIITLIFGWIGWRSPDRNQAVAEMVLVIIGLCPLAIILLFTMIFGLAFRGMGA